MTYGSSTVTRPLGFVTLTPSALAFAMISTRFLDETACPILFRHVNTASLWCVMIRGKDILSSKGAGMHEQKLNILGVVDEEGLVS